MSLVRRDGRVDGSFCYGVKTTGVFCRPSCPSRLPRRSNVLFFASATEAHAAGFRPCRRCRPDIAVRAEPHLDRIVRVCDLIETAERPPSLAKLAEAVGLCPSHLHRVFKRAVGVTPKGYTAALRAQRLKDGLRPGVTVTRALYDAGFGSGSRLYANAGEQLGMSPARYRSGGEGIPIRFATARTDLGWVLVAGTERGICAIDLGDSREALIDALKARFDRAEHCEGDPEFVRWVYRVTESIVSPRHGLDLPLDIRGTAFQRRVWQELRRIPAGRTASYGRSPAGSVSPARLAPWPGHAHRIPSPWPFPVTGWSEGMGIRAVIAGVSKKSARCSRGRPRGRAGDRIRCETVIRSSRSAPNAARAPGHTQRRVSRDARRPGALGMVAVPKLTAD
jgi:AraC family transcriptional regulator of adaptative response/methylated-DNA-[protein]-cysteine methyltransferase